MFEEIEKLANEETLSQDDQIARLKKLIETQNKVIALQGDMIDKLITEIMTTKFNLEEL